MRGEGAKETLRHQCPEATHTKYQPTLHPDLTIRPHILNSTTHYPSKFSNLNHLYFHAKLTSKTKFKIIKITPATNFEGTKFELIYEMTVKNRLSSKSNPDLTLGSTSLGEKLNS